MNLNYSSWFESISSSWNTLSLSLTKNESPYKDGTLENTLINLIKEIIPNRPILIRLLVNNFISRVIPYLAEHYKHQKSADIFDPLYLAKYSIWLCLTNHILEVKEKPKKSFALFIEFGLADFSSKEWTDPINKSDLSKNTKKNLKKIISISSHIRKKYSIPFIKKGKNKLTIHNVPNQNNFIISNAESIPIHGYSTPSLSYIGLEPGGRSVFHHLGDEFAVISASLALTGYCYIVSRNEFGDLTILHEIKKPENKEIYKPGSIVSEQTFFATISVDRCRTFYPSKLCSELNYTEKHYNTKFKTDFNYVYYKSPTFLSTAGRNIMELTMSEACQIFLRKTKEIMGNKIWQEHISLINNLNSFDSFPTSSSHIEYMEAVPHITENRLAALSKFKRLFSIHEEINPKIEKECSFFYKLIAQKIDCGIINAENKENGFFKKGAPEDSQKYKLIDYFKYLYNEFNAIREFETKDKKIELTEDLINSLFPKFFINNVLSPVSKDGHRNLQQLNKLYLATNEKCILMSNVIDLKYEYRIFVINGKLAAGAACWRDSTPWQAWTQGRMNPYLADGHSAPTRFYNSESRQIVSRYAKFARKFIKNVLLENSEHHTYVLDVGLKVNSDGTTAVVPIEINGASQASPYAVDVRRVCSAYLGIPFNIETFKDDSNFSQIWWKN